MNYLIYGLIFLAVFNVIYVLYQNVLYPINQKLKKRNSGGYIIINENEYEHRLLAEKALKRKLKPNEVVHHINGKPWDNRLTNLAVMDSKAHDRWHSKLNWMHNKRMFPSIKWQKKNLIKDFGAILL